MNIEINTIEDLNSHLDALPISVLEDINKRMTDWIASGGTSTDNYIKQQFRYAENYINFKNN